MGRLMFVDKNFSALTPRGGASSKAEFTVYSYSTPSITMKDQRCSRRQGNVVPMLGLRFILIQ